MTDEEIRLYMEALRRVENNRRIRQIFENLMADRRRQVVHDVYRSMGFEVVLDSSLGRMDSISTTSRFVDVENDFYDRD